MDELTHKLAASKLKAFDANDLWQKDTYVDLAAGEITMLTPVSASGIQHAVDARHPKFYSSCQVTFGGQSFAVPFEIVGATTLLDACEKWADAAAEAGRLAVERCEENQRRMSIIQPSAIPRRLN